MAVKFDSQSLDSRKGGTEYKYSLSAIENAWSNIASAKEKLDFMDRRIRSAANIINDGDSPGDQIQLGTNKFVRKYGRRTTKNRVKIDPNPKVESVRDKNDFRIGEYEINESEADKERFRRYGASMSPRAHSEHLLSYGDRHSASARDSIIKDFDYEPHDILPSEKLFTAKIPKLDSSIDKKSLLSNIKDSGAIERIRKQIKQQKENLSSPEMQALPSKPKHSESDCVQLNDYNAKGPMKRKVASSVQAPSYKGFNIPEAKENTPQTMKSVDNINRKIAAHKERKERVGSIYPKSKPSRTAPKDNKSAKKDSKRSPSKMQRIVASRRPVPSITARSWRVGQEAVKKVLQAMKASKQESSVKSEYEELSERLGKKESGPEESDSDHDSEREDQSRKSKSHATESDELRSGSLKSDQAKQEAENKTIQESTEVPEDDSQGTDDLEKMSRDLHRNEDLPTVAKSMLADLQLDPSDSEERNLSPKVSTTTSAHGVVKSPGLKKRAKRKSPQAKRKHDDNVSRPKIRHYDQEEIQNYMAKQLADRKMKRLQEKRREKQMKLEQEQKLKELYIKQKSSLRSSLSSRHPKSLGTTFTKHDQHEQRSQSIQDKSRQETAVRRLMGDDSITEHQEKDEVIPPSSPPAGESSMHERPFSAELKESMENGEADEEFRDSLEFDKFETPGITNITVKKVKDGLPAQPIHQEAREPKDFHDLARSVESEVRELLEKYKASQQIGPKVEERKSGDSLTTATIDRSKLSKAERIAAISATATSLRGRLAVEANRLAYLRLDKNDEEPFASPPAPVMPTAYSTEFRGVLPGTKDIHEQAKTNEEILKKEEAATKIQAAFRGHSIRQGLTWKLPSGKTFGASLREMRQKSAAALSYKKQLEAEDEPFVTDSYTHTFDPESDVDLFSDKTTTESLIQEAEKPSKPRASVRPKFESLKVQPSRESDEYGDSLKEIFGRIEDPKGDRYSMINVLSRRLKDVVKKDVMTNQVEIQGKEDKATEPGIATNEDLYEQDFEDDEYDSLSSTIKSGVESIDERDNEQWTTVLSEKDNLKASKLERDRPSLSAMSKKSKNVVEEDPDKTLTLLPDDWPRDEDPSVKIISYHSDLADSTRSPGRSRVSLAEESDNYENVPDVSSNMERTADVSQQQRRGTFEQDTSLTATSTTSDKFSPSTLERKLRAEVNQLETMDDALRQVTDMERVRGVTLAQQETVSLAHILKARQLGYKQELEQMSKVAAEQAIKSSKEVERANATAAQASENAAKRLAEIRAEAAEVVAESTKKLEEVQKEAASRANEAADKVEKAHKMASDVAIESANRYANDIQNMATAAASVAASSAVQAAMQVHREQLEQLRNEALKRVSRSYSQSIGSSTPSHSESASTITPSNSMTDKQESKTSEVSYGDDDFEEPSYRKSSVLEDISKEGKNSTEESAVKSNVKSKNVSKSSISEDRKSDFEKSLAESIKEDIDESKFDDNTQSTRKTVKSDIGKHSTPVKEGDNLKSGFEDFLQKSEIEERSFKIDEHILSSLTEDEIDDGFRMVLPVMSHRRKSLDRERRSRREKALSDNGTSSDEMKHTPRSTAKHGKHSPFAGEDTFGQFTNDLVKQYIQEEEIRSTHQRALLKLREKALLEKAKAEMAWLEMQKSTLRNKGADDLMPPLNKKQRGLWLKLQSEQSEIRRLKQAYRAASHERRFMLYQQEEIVRLKEETQKIWSKLGRDKVAKNHDIRLEEKSQHTDKSPSEASSIASVDQSSNVSYDSASKSHSFSIPSKVSKKSSYGPNTKSSTSTKSTKRDSKSSASTTEMPEEILSTQEQENSNTKDPSFPTYSGGSKRSSDTRLESSKIQEIEDEESTADDVSITERTQSSMMVDLKKLAKKASEQYLIKREKVLQERRSKFESILNNHLGVADKKQRVETEEFRLKSDIKKALDKLKVKTKPLSMGTSSHEDASESSESTIKSQRISTASHTSSIKSVLSKDKSSGSESSVTEDIKAAASIVTDSAAFEESKTSDGVRKASKTSIQDEYGEDSFYTPSARTTVSKSISYQPDNLITSSVRSSAKKRYSKDSDESKSEDDVSVADAASDASDIEKRIRQLEDELLKRRKDLDRIRKNREKDQLRKQEQRLKQELQAVESLIIQENINHERSITESNSLMKAPISPKIMSPKVLQSVNQHDHLSKKQPRESKAFNDTKEVTKGDQSSVYKSRRDKSGSSLSESVNNRANQEAKDKSEKETDTLQNGLSDEVDSLRINAQRSVEKSISVNSTERVGADAKENIREVDIDNSVLSNSPKDRSTSPSLSEEISVQSTRSSVADSKKSPRKSQSISLASEVSKDVNSLSSRTKLSSRRSLDELAKTADSVVVSLKDASDIKEQNSDERSDSVHSVSENIFSEKSIEEEISQGRSLSVATDIRRDEEYDDIYIDDFFESSSSTKALQNKFKVDTQDEESTKPALEEKMGEIHSTRDEIASASEVSSKLGSVMSDSVTSKTRDNSIKENISEALSMYESFSVNDRVIVDGILKGIIRYIGRTSFSPVAVAGIELDEKVGNTDGKFRSKRYFTCRPDYGLFSPVANIGHLESKDDFEKIKETKKEKDISINDSMTESVKTNIEVDPFQESELSKSLTQERENQGLIKMEANQRSEGNETIAVNEKESSYSRSVKEISYKDDFEDEEKSATVKDLNYLDDFEDMSVREERSSVSRIDTFKSESHKGTSRETDYLPSQADLEVEEFTDKGKDYLSFDDVQFPLKKDMAGASPSTLSEVESSDIEIVPHPPRLSLDDLAETLTDRLLETLMIESVNITQSVIERNMNDRIMASLPPSVISSAASPASSSVASPTSSPTQRSDLHQIGNLKFDESALPSNVLNSLYEKSGHAAEELKGSHMSEEELDLEVSEAFISPAISDALQPDESSAVMPTIHEDSRLPGLQKFDDEQKPKLVEDTIKANEEARKTVSPDRGVAERGIEEISRSLMLEAISQMMNIVKEKNAKIDNNNKGFTGDSGNKTSEEDEKVMEMREAEPKTLLGDLPKLSMSPPKSPTDHGLEKKQPAFDTDLLAAKLSELKRMDQEIDVLLDEESDDDEQFPQISKGILPKDHAPDAIPPVRIFDYSEPIIHVPNTQKDVSGIVADSAKIVSSVVANGTDFDDVKPSEAFLRSETKTTDRDIETSSNILFKRMIFDVTRDLMKEVNEFKQFQTIAKKPWMRQSRRVFAKFIRQIHTLTGDELMKSFQDHISICLGLKEGRPSLDLLKKRLPLNTSKKDYIDALLVEELREEEPNWVNYDEDEVRVKEQLTDGILESLITETVDILNQSRLR